MSTGMAHDEEQGQDRPEDLGEKFQRERERERTAAQKTKERMAEWYRTRGKDLRREKASKRQRPDGWSSAKRYKQDESCNGRGEEGRYPQCGHTPISGPDDGYAFEESEGETDQCFAPHEQRALRRLVLDVLRWHADVSVKKAEGGWGQTAGNALMCALGALGITATAVNQKDNVQGFLSAAVNRFTPSKPPSGEPQDSSTVLTKTNADSSANSPGGQQASSESTPEQQSSSSNQ